MKQKDIALFIIIGVISAIISVVASNFFFTPDNVKQQKAEKVDTISAEFTIPTADNKYFNKDSINPTKLIQIGDDANNTPFNGGN